MQTTWVKRFLPALFRTFLLLLSLCAGFPSQAALPQIKMSALEGLDLRTGTQTSISFTESKPKVVVFLSARCPCSQSHEAKLKSLAREFNDVSFVAVHSNANESVDEAKTYFSKRELPFAVLQDTGARWADAFGAFKTPHAFVLDSKGAVVFSGGLDESHRGEGATQNYVKDALLALKNASLPSPAETRSLGCVIAR